MDCWAAGGCGDFDGVVDVNGFAGMRGGGACGTCFPVKEQAEALRQAPDHFLGGVGGVGFAEEQCALHLRISDRFMTDLLAAHLPVNSAFTNH